MYVWEQSEIVKTYRLTVAMVWALLGVGRVRPSTWAALMRRDLAEHATDDGYRLTPTGQDVADELHNLTAEPEDQTPDITTDDGPTFPECEDAGAHVESEAATHGAAAEVVDVPSTPDHETSDCGWPPLWPNGAPAPREDVETEPLPSLTRADEVHAGDYVLHTGTRRQVIGTRTEGRDIVLSTVHGTLTMPPGTPLRIEPAQLSLSLAG